VRCGAVSFAVNEFSVVLLHLLSALHDHLLQQPGFSLVVTMLSKQALRDEVDERIQCSAAQPGAASSSAEAHGQPLLFSALSASPSHSPLRLRWCRSWSEATRVFPPRVVYLPSLMWLIEDCSFEQAGRYASAMLHEVGATVWPPFSWEAMVEHKDKIYSQFNKFMLPARWVKMDAVEGSVERLASSLLGFCYQQGRGDGRYFIKGSLSCGKICGKEITITDGQCPELVEVLREWVEKQHQTAFGIQPFMPGFDEFELRTWLVADRVAGRWRSALTIKTQFAHGVATVELYQPIHGKGLRIAQLVDDMLLQRASFFEQLLQLGLPALRVDCGYDDAGKRAFFSEFAACQASMWTEVHDQDLAYVVGREMGEAMWTKLLEAP